MVLCEHPGFPFMFPITEVLPQPAFPLSVHTVWVSVVLLLLWCRHCGFFSAAALSGPMYFLNPVGNPTKQQMHLSNVKAKPSNAARITP